jgi:methyl-accepting chemotaxis protein
MRQISIRLTGILLVLGAVLGTVLAVGGLLFVWRAEASVSDALTETIDLLDATLVTTSESLELINGMLLGMKGDLAGIRLSLDDASRSMQATADVTDSVADLIGEDFSVVVSETQQSLLTVQNSAQMIDNTLSLISRIPLIGPSLSGGYRVDMPLGSSIQGVSESLEPVSGSLKDVQSGLKQTSQNFELMKEDLENLIGTIDGIESSLADAEIMMTDYQVLFARSQEKLQNARAAAPKMVRNALLAGTVFFIWLLIAQVAMLLQGVDMMLRRRVVTVTRRPELIEHHPE